VPNEEGWVINRCSSDPTSGSLRKTDAGAIRTNAKVVKAKAFTQKRR